jgi:hypothetical protein
MILRFSQALVLIIIDGYRTLLRQRRWRLLPAFTLFLLLALALVFAKAISPIAPFVYALF